MLQNYRFFIHWSKIALIKSFYSMSVLSYSFFIYEFWFIFLWFLFTLNLILRIIVILLFDLSLDTDISFISNFLSALLFQIDRIFRRTIFLNFRSWILFRWSFPLFITSHKFIIIYNITTRNIEIITMIDIPINIHQFSCHKRLFDHYLLTAYAFIDCISTVWHVIRLKLWYAIINLLDLGFEIWG